MRRKNYYRPYGGRRDGGWKKVLCALLAVMVLAFAALEAVVLLGGRDELRGEPEVMVIFGCQVKPWGPSVLLQDRLDAALDYLEEHPDMTVVVTGGKGDDEHVSEAQCMYDYLTANGVEGEQILMEDRSRNTWQNINYTIQLLAEKGYDTTNEILLVSNDFHLTRIRMLYDRAYSADHASTLAAPVSHIPSRVKMFFREPLALVKSFLLDR